MGERSRIVGRLLVVISCIVILSTSFTSAVGAAVATKTAIPYQDTGYRYLVVPSGGGASNFQDLSFNDSGWSMGAAGFGTAYSGCALTSSTYIATAWPLNTDILVRKHFALPAGATNLTVNVAIDNDVQVFVNGVDVSGGTATHEGCAERDSIQISVADSVLRTGNNVIAVRGIDRGTADYLDLQVTYDVPTYQIHPLYDTATAHRSGSTVPVKLQAFDENGNNVSSTGVVLHTTSVQIVNGVTANAVRVSSSANSPDMDFRYDPRLNGYIFNLSTKGLTSGTWRLNFTVDGEVQPNYYAEFVVR